MRTHRLGWRLPSILFALLLVVTAGTSALASQDYSSADSMGNRSTALYEKMEEFDLTKPVEDWTHDDINVFVNLLYAQDTLGEDVGPEVSIADLKHIMSQFSENQGRIFAESLSKLVREIKSSENSFSHEPPHIPSESGGTVLGPYWTQNIEHTGLTAGSSVYPNFAYDSTYTCDTDPDNDIVFNFTFNSDDPDSLRWDSSSLAFTAAVGVSNGWPFTNYDLKGFGYIGNNSVSLCTPEEAVTAGGVARLC